MLYSLKVQKVRSKDVPDGYTGSDSPLGEASNTRGFFYFKGIEVRFCMLEMHTRSDFFIAPKAQKGKEGIHMRITQTTQSMKQAERMAFLFALSQVALALGLFWAFKAHLV